MKIRENIEQNKNIRGREVLSKVEEVYYRKQYIGKGRELRKYKGISR